MVLALNKILIANRGEIAVRIIRTAQNLGYETVAVFSDADADAPHVGLADQAVRLGSAEVGESYLHTERILAAAQRVGADAIHPGYGFLAENAAFAQQVIAAGLTWIGPPPEAMTVIGHKTAAKQAVAATTVPCVPGYMGAEQSDEALIAAAESIGYPVMIKAAAGGGGRGMRLVTQASQLPAALAGARAEALSAFGSAELLLEKAIINPRHIEVQIFGDQQGNLLYLGERDCSIQRRHQKVIEESPSPAVSSELRQRLGEAAVVVARTVDYYSAGTVEFLLDESGQFYFIEMNTRLQVEHPVTEMITGLDLVAWQLLVAEGQTLPLTQAEIKLKGHAIEVRLYAEDPEQRFLPSIGRIHFWQPPMGAGIRVDHGLAPSLTITPHYDALLAKIIAWGETREVARRRLRQALRQTTVFGVTTNRRFLLEAIDHDIFIQGQSTTSFIGETWRPIESQSISMRLEALAALLFYRQHRGDDMGEWRSRPFTCCFDRHNRDRLVRVTAVGDQQYHIQTAAETVHVRYLSQDHHSLRFEQDGVQDRLFYVFDPDGRLWLQYKLSTVSFEDVLLAPPAGGDGSSDGQITAPMPGAIMQIHATLGQKVVKGQSLLILEAMKMEHVIPAPFAGTVVEILVQTGQQMKSHDLLMVVQPEE